MPLPVGTDIRGLQPLPGLSKPPPVVADPSVAQSRVNLNRVQAAEKAAVLPYTAEITAANLREAQAKADKAEIDVQTTRRAAAQSAPDLDGLRANITGVIEAARKAQKISRENAFATGFGSDWAITQFGGSPRKALEGALQPIRAQTALAALSDMKKQGVSLVPVSNEEVKLAMDSIASMDPNQPDDAFAENMDAIAKRFTTILHKLDKTISPAMARRVLMERRQKRGKAAVSAGLIPEE